jgi:hypothetical protein
LLFGEPKAVLNAELVMATLLLPEIFKLITLSRFKSERLVLDCQFGGR